jgi:uncharacterized protein involved in copper resistance
MGQTDFFSFPVYQLHEDSHLASVPAEINDLVIVADKEDSKQELENQILKIARSVGKDQDTTTIFYLAQNQGLDTQSLLGSGRKLLIISFGIQGKRLGVQMENVKYDLLKFGDATFLFADTVESLQRDVDKKRRLWAALKMYFHL